MILGPENRHLLLDALRPPPGARLDQAVGTSFTLDLRTMMTVPLGMAMFDRTRDDGSVLEDPVAMLQALRHYASRITLFCQAGQIAVPSDYRKLMVYLEDSVFPVSTPRTGGIFHPKVWFIRYLDADERATWRLLCLTRNLTFSRSWDTVLRLDGEPGDSTEWPALTEFIDALPRMAAVTRPVPPDRAATIRQFGNDIATVRWTLPTNFDRVKFVPVGHDGVPAWPFPSRKPMLVISPYVTGDTLHRLTGRTTSSVLVSRGGSLDALGEQAVRHLAERFVFSPDAALTDDETDHLSTDEAVAEGTEHNLGGLHAKLYVAEEGSRTRYWTGSANATDAAFHANVEFLVELGGRTRDCGIDKLVGDPDDRSALGLRSLLEPYTPPNVEPIEPDETEILLRRLADIARHLGSLAYTATCTRLEQEDRWHLQLVADAGHRNVASRLPDDVTVRIRPLTLGDGYANTPEVTEHGLAADFHLSTEAITPFFVVSVAIDDEAHASLIRATLCNAPSDRAERVLSEILANPADLIRFLLLLLGDTESGLAAAADDDKEGDGVPLGGGWLAALGSGALLEPLVRAYSRDPQRLHEIDRVLREIARANGGKVNLPPGWAEIWEPIVVALDDKEVAP